MTGAIKDYNIVIKLNRRDADGYYNRANAKSDLGRHKSAIKDYNKTIKLDPKYAPAYLNRGISKYELRDYKGALNDYNKAARINSSYISFKNKLIKKINQK